MSTSLADSHLETLAPAIARIDGWLSECIEAAEVPENLRAAARHAVLGGGKRLRPLLSVMWCEACGGTPEDARHAAVSIELIHAFSLVHDDLPALDNDLLRRGQPTVHARFGEAMAILAGDLLMSLAFELASDPRAAGLPAAELAAATTRMINGQVLDTLGGFDARDREPLQRLRRIHGHKTGALITAACRMGAAAAAGTSRPGHSGERPRGAPAAPASPSAAAGRLEAATSYGDAIGLMFQIVDDLLDVTQSTEHLGKAAGKDESAGKLTFPGVLGVEASRAQVARLRIAALEAVAPLGAAGQALRELAEYMAVRTR